MNVSAVTACDKIGYRWVKELIYCKIAVTAIFDKPPCPVDLTLFYVLSKKTPDLSAPFNFRKRYILSQCFLMDLLFTCSKTRLTENVFPLALIRTQT